MSSLVHRLQALLARIRGTARPNDTDARYDEETRFHIDMQTERNLRDGMTPDEARRAALVQFGGRSRYQEEARDEYRSRALDDLTRDLRASLRTVRRHPGFSIATVATMAIGIAATASIFSVADAFLFRPLPFRDAERLVMLGDVQGTDDWMPASYLEFTDWRSMSREASAVVASVHGGMTYTTTEAAERFRVGRVSNGYFELFGVRPVLGRTFAAQDHAEGAARVVVLSRATWSERFGGRRDVQGQRLTLNGQSHEVIGVVESAMELGADRTQMWVPLEPYAPWRDRGTHYLTVFARLRDGATLASLARELDDVGRRIREANETTHAIVADGLRERIVGSGRDPLLIMLVSVGLLLLISIANVAGLLQARTASRATELAVRTALGASRWRLIRQIVTESTVLALFGGVAGVVLSVWLTKGLVWLWPTTVPRPVEFQVDARVIALALGLSVLGAFVAAVLTAVAKRGSVSLSDRATGGVGSSRRMRATLVASEVAVTVLLLVGAGLTMQSLRNTLRTDMGFVTEQVLTARVPMQGDSAKLRAFYGQVLERLGALPGVQDVGAAGNLPLTGAGMSGDFAIQGREYPRDSLPVSEKAIVSPGYFTTMGIRLLSGRAFEERDVFGAPEVAVINETMAKRFWPGASPIGQRVRILGDSTRWQEIVGVVADTRIYALDQPPVPIAYLPFHQWPQPMAILIRTPTPAAVETALRGIVRGIDPLLPVVLVQPYDRIVYRATHGRRVPAVLLGAFAALALALAGVGLYGLLAYAVQQRRHEMGVRMAIGAQRSAVVRLVMGEGLRLVAVGALIGLAAALGLTRFIASLLYGVEPTEPSVFVGAAVVVVAVACLASAAPALRASRVDPATVLRSD